MLCCCFILETEGIEVEHANFSSSNAADSLVALQQRTAVDIDFKLNQRERKFVMQQMAKVIDDVSRLVAFSFFFVYFFKANKSSLSVNSPSFINPT